MAATDLLSLSDAMTALRLGQGVASDKSDRVATYVAAVSNRLDRACGPIVQRQVIEYLSGWWGPGSGGISSYVSYISGGYGSAWIRMKTCPVASFTSVTEYQSGQTAGALTLETATTPGGFRAERFYSTDPPGLYSGKLWRRTGGYTPSLWAVGDDNIVVVAQAGRYANTAAVRGTRFGQAAILLLKHYWAAEDLNVAVVGGYDAPTPTFPMTMPYSIRELLANDWLEGIAVG